MLMELGGNNPTIVCADAVLPDAVDGVVAGAFGVAGQNCLSVQRVYVHASIYDEFLRETVARTSRLKVGSKQPRDTDIGPLVSESDAQRVEEWVGKAVADGAVVHTGGVRRGAFYEPTVLTDVTRRRQVLTDEVFGPVVTIIPFDELGERGSRRRTSSDYALQAGVFTQSVETAFGCLRTAGRGSRRRQRHERSASGLHALRWVQGLRHRPRGRAVRRRGHDRAEEHDHQSGAAACRGRAAGVACRSRQLMTTEQSGTSALARLRDLGYALPDAPHDPKYAAYQLLDSSIHIAGQLPYLNGELPAQGVLGRDLNIEQGQELARLAAINALAVASAAVGTLDRVRVVQMLVFVASTGEFGDQSKVADGASELLATVLGDHGRHARTAIGVAALPRNSPVEIQMVCADVAPQAG